MEIVNEYSPLIEEVYKEIRKALKSKIVFFNVIGSASSNEVFANWSDIDLIIVINKYDLNLINTIQDIVSRYQVKIGTTIYTKKEFENKLIDPKTYYYLYLVQKKIIKNHYCSNKLTLNQISFSELRNNYIIWLNEHIHAYKRSFISLDINNTSKRNIFKNTYLIMKALLVINGYTPNNYKEVFTLFSKEFNYPKYNYKKLINNAIKTGEIEDNIVIYGKKFAEYLSNDITSRVNKDEAIKITSGNKIFKYRVSAIVIKQDKILVDFIKDFPYCNLIGGYVNLYESSSDAIIREFKEETNIDINIKNLFGIVENFFTNNKKQQVHEISVFYLVDGNIPTNDFIINEIEQRNNINHNYKWIKFSALKENNFKPNFIIDKLLQNDHSFFHQVFNDNDINE